MNALDLGNPLFNTFSLQSKFVELHDRKERKKMSTILHVFTSSRTSVCRVELSSWTVVDRSGTGCCSA